MLRIENLIKIINSFIKSAILHDVNHLKIGVIKHSFLIILPTENHAKIMERTMTKP